jgi:hypothetical protein
MGHRYDGTGVDASGGFPIIEKEGWYPFRITVATPGKSKDGDFQVVVDSSCLDPHWKDYGVRHWVTFLPKENRGAGMALHFLSCIGEPHEGVFEVEPLAWERKTFMGKVIISEYQGKRNNKFEAVSPIKDDTGIEFGEPAPSQRTAFDE